MLGSSGSVTGYGYSTPVLPDWTLDSDPAYEMVNAGWNGIAPSDGTYWLDMDASPGNIRISQTILGPDDGLSYQLSFEAADLNADGVSANSIRVYWGGELIGSLGGLTTNMLTYSIELIGGAGDGSNVLSFEATGDADDIGASLDNVRLFSNADIDGKHNDSIEGGSGKDQITASAGNDTVNGGSDDDFINGGTGNDSLMGGSSGADIIIGDWGADTMNGGSGADTFVYRSYEDSNTPARDLIIGWDANDIFDLANYTAFDFGFNNIAFGAGSGSTLGYTYVSGNTIIKADPFVADFTIELQGIHNLINADFIYV